MGKKLTRNESRSYSPYRCLVVTSIVLCQSIFCGAVSANSASNESALDLTSVGIEDLMNISVTSVSKKEQKLANAAAAVYVITGEDIRRSGVTSIPEALRMAPGVNVARIDANKWAVSIRGFLGRFSNKLLVLVDGRTIYSPLFSGVFWEAEDTLLEDVDRIEVIRGPGAALWGGNAVNGVINIITKPAEDTVGGLVSGGGGTQERGFAAARYGVGLSESTFVRLYAKHLDRNNFVDASGHATHDDWHSTQGGFRLDSHLTESDAFTIQGDYHDAGIGETYTMYGKPPLPNPDQPSQSVNTRSGQRGGNLLTRWQRTLSGADSLSLQLYYTRSEWDTIIGSEERNTVDVDFQHHFALGTRQDIVWGLGYRLSSDETGDTQVVTFSPANKTERLISGFLHDEISLVKDRLSLIIGSRFEHNDYSGFEIQPTGRLLWTPNEKNSFWGSVSRAVRTPSRTDQDSRYNYITFSRAETQNLAQQITLTPEQQALLQLYKPNSVVTINGSTGFKPEEVLAYELGYRTELSHSVTLDLATFYNDYKKLRGTTGEAPDFITMPGSILIPYTVTNNIYGHTYGVELSASWSPLEWWRMQASYGFLKMAMYLNGSSTDQLNKRNLENNCPNHQFSVRNSLDLGMNVSLDLWLRGVSDLKSIKNDLSSDTISGYVTMDTRIAWKPQKKLELAVVGQNLFQDHQREFVPDLIHTIPSEVGRSVYGKVTWLF